VCELVWSLLKRNFSAAAAINGGHTSLSEHITFVNQRRFSHIVIVKLTKNTHENDTNNYRNDNDAAKNDYNTFPTTINLKNDTVVVANNYVYIKTITLQRH